MKLRHAVEGGEEFAWDWGVERSWRSREGGEGDRTSRESGADEAYEQGRFLLCRFAAWLLKGPALCYNNNVCVLPYCIFFACHN